MNDALKTLSDEVAKNLKAKIESPEFASFMAKAKEAGDDRTFEVVMSTSDEDRQGDSLDQSGWDFKYFDMNPVLLWAHNYQSFPIGIITDIRIEGEKAIATGKFAPQGINPEADLACSLYQEKILRAVSPGYIQNDDGTRELLEVSFCPVPAGRYALSMRQMRSIGLSTRELIAKGFFYKTNDPPPAKAQDDPKIGDACEGDDGTPGVLSKDPKNPDRLICVPNESKSNETQDNMNDELEKKLKAEHERHRKAIEKHIDEFEEKAVPGEKAEDGKEGSDNSEMEKAIQEFEEKMDSEQEDHLEKCMKAVDSAYEIDPDKKSIDEFKKAMEDEHLKHVKCFDKAIEEFKAEATDPEKCAKAIAEFRTKAEDELERHEQAHMDMVKAEFGEGEDEGKEEKAIKFIIGALYLEKFITPEQVKAIPEEVIKKLAAKSGRTISSKTKGKIEEVMKSIEEFHAKHTAEHEEFTNNAIAALKELKGSPQGDEGKDDEEDNSRTPKSRSATSGAKTDTGSLTELDAYLLTQRLARKIKSEAEGILRQVKKELKDKHPGRR